ncbi:hypothetical protein B296_00008374 [Ensete ventricosum]|uniref:Uncharacterized protein n=1 Tax=Ensete ventricosum TaxID=4639 RepID=A0A427AFA0_ENSVE|nr:hypothetical protein B296_00008374 [Ensete ventricosum]
MLCRHVRKQRHLLRSNLLSRSSPSFNESSGTTLDLFSITYPLSKIIGKCCQTIDLTFLTSNPAPVSSEMTSTCFIPMSCMLQEKMKGVWCSSHISLVSLLLPSLLVMMAASRTFLAMISSLALFMVLMSTAAMAADGPSPPPTTGGGESFSVRQLPSVAFAFFVSFVSILSLAY